MLSFKKSLRSMNETTRPMT